MSCACVSYTLTQKTGILNDILLYIISRSALVHRCGVKLELFTSDALTGSEGPALEWENGPSWRNLSGTAECGHWNARKLP